MSQATSGPVGVIGLGLMGTAQARRLIEAGYDVVGYDIDAAARDRLAAIGGKPVASLAEIAETCPRAVIAVFDTQQVEDVTEGAQGLLSVPEERRKTRLVVSTSTCEPDRVAALAERLAPRGLALVELPLSGTSDGVARGQAIGLIGGADADIAACEDLFEAICKQTYRMGAVGNGGRTKLAINHILGVNRAGLAEGLVLAERMGLELEPFMEAARGSAAYSQVMSTKGPKMMSGDFEPHGKVAQSRKDFTLINAEGAARGQPLPLASVYLELMQALVDAGEGELDNAAIIKEIRRRGDKNA